MGNTSVLLSDRRKTVTVKDATPMTGLHQLKGRKKGIWAVKVTGNWRVTFSFKEGNAESVNYEDYH